MSRTGRPKKNNGLCAKCGENQRVSYSKSYCKQCHGSYNLKYRKTEIARRLKETPRVGICLKCKDKKELYTPMLYYCLECCRKYFSKHEADYRKRKWDWLKSLKENGSCTDCGKSYAYYNMHWDHLQDKEFNIGSALRIGKEKVLKELAKCELVCAICHGDRTHRRRQEASANSL